MISAPSSRQTRWLYPGLITLVGLGWFFFRLGTPGLMDPDEGRYAEIAREMLLLKDWLIPHLNLVPYLEKPPLVYWATALSFMAFGFKEWAARLPSALSALGGVYLAYGLGRALWGERQGFWGAMILATSWGYLIMARVLTLDMALSFFLTLALGLGYLALSRDREKLWPWAYLALALAVLVKGPVALVLAGLIWGLGALLRGWRALKGLVRPGCWFLLAVVVLPWFFYAAWRYPEFPRFFLWEHHVARYVDGALYHQEPWWYFGPILLGFLIPWTFLMPWVLGRRSAVDFQDRLFLILWAGAVLVFYSLSRGKLPPYILPALLPLALLGGEALVSLSSSGAGLRRAPGFRLSLLLWALVAWIAVVLYFWPPAVLKALLLRAEALKPYPGIGLLVLALVPTVTLLARRLEVLLVGALLLGAIVPPVVDRISLQRSPKELGLTLRAHWQPDAALVGIYLYSQSLSFYSRQVFHLLDFSTELNFGKKLAPQSGLFFPRLENMDEFLASRPLVFFYLKTPEFNWLKTQLSGDFKILARQKDCLLVGFRRQYP